MQCKCIHALVHSSGDVDLCDGHLVRQFGERVDVGYLAVELGTARYIFRTRLFVRAHDGHGAKREEWRT